MFLFIISCRGNEAIISEQKETRLNNKEELKNHLFNVLKDFDNINSLVNRAQFSDAKKLMYKFESSKYYQNSIYKDGLYRTLAIKATFISSVKNNDGSFSVKHCTVTSSRELFYQIPFESGINYWLKYNEYTNPYEYQYCRNTCVMCSQPRIRCNTKRIEALKGPQIQQIFNELNDAINQKRNNILQWL